MHLVQIKKITSQHVFAAAWKAIPLLKQVSYRLWKSWKIMELQHFIFQAWKVMEYKLLLVLEGHGKLTWVLFDR